MLGRRRHFDVQFAHPRRPRDPRRAWRSTCCSWRHPFVTNAPGRRVSSAGIGRRGARGAERRDCLDGGGTSTSNSPTRGARGTPVGPGGRHAAHGATPLLPTPPLRPLRPDLGFCPGGGEWGDKIEHCRGTSGSVPTFRSSVPTFAPPGGARDRRGTSRRIPSLRTASQGPIDGPLGRAPRGTFQLVTFSSSSSSSSSSSLLLLPPPFSVRDLAGTYDAPSPL